MLKVKSKVWLLAQSIGRGDGMKNKRRDHLTPFTPLFVAKLKKQAGAELGQAQPKLDFGLIEISLNRVETSLSK